MPETPPGRRRPVITAGARTVLPSPGSYAELHCRTNFSFLEGASHPDELVSRAAELGLTALAVTDRNSLAGVVRAHVAAKTASLKLVIGAEITPIDAPPLLLWAMNRSGYGRLCRLISQGRMNAVKGDCRLRLSDVLNASQDLLAGVLLTQSVTVASRLAASRVREAFENRLYAVAELHCGPNDRRLLQTMKHQAGEFGLPLIAANEVCCHVPSRQMLQDVLTATRHGCTVSELGHRRFSNAERHLKSAARMRAMFRGCEDAVARTQELADRCTFSLDELRYEYPAELCPAGSTEIEFLTQLTWEGAVVRYPRGLPEKIRRLIEHELTLIGELRYAAYFLTVWDLVRFARGRGILCQGRGSAANSAVCFCLGVTEVDPERIDVLFERFISKERNEAPDIDVDFEHERREEVIQYLYEKYGRERAAMTAAVATYRPRSAIRDVGKALGLSVDRIDALSKHVDHLHDQDRLASRFQEAGLPPDSLLGQQMMALVAEMLEFPRHLSQHSGGMVLSNGPLCELVPIENAAMPGRTVIEWDKNDLDALGLMKVDVLALGMLSAIRRCFDVVRNYHGRNLTLASIPADDQDVYTMIGQSDTIGVFQIESRAQMAMLPRLKPRCFYDLVIEVAIVRPGPIQGDMVHPYLRRRCGEEPVEYPDERIRSVLDKTLGVPIFQEQAMRLAIVAAGFTPGEADQLRRAMGAWRKRGLIDQFHRQLIHGMTTNGYSLDFAERVFHMIRGFGEYGFPESHAASFALLVWASAWLKHHYPAAFAAALLNSQPMGFYAPSQLVSDARRHHVPVLSVDVNHSDWDCTLEEDHTARCRNGERHRHGGRGGDDHRQPRSPALRLGFRMVSGLSETDGASIVRARGTGPQRKPFVTVDEFAERTGLANAVLTRLSRADAFGSLQQGRRSALWNSLPSRQSAPLFDRKPQDAEPVVPLPALAPFEEVVADYRTTGLSLRNHPVCYLRPLLTRRRVTPAAELALRRDNQFVHVAGLVLLRQRPGSANGITFVTLEDETGMTNLIIRQSIWELHHRVVRTATVLIAHGTLQRQDSVIHVVVGRLEDLSAELSAVRTSSRDFR